MNARKLCLLIGIVLLAGAWPQTTVAADMGPKPTMKFAFVQKIPGPPLTMVSWSLYNCQDAECASTGEIVEFGDSFQCAANSCDTHVFYNINEPYFQMEITFSDGVTRKSNVFTRRYFDSRYRVIVQPEALSVKELKGSNVNGFMILFLFGSMLFYPVLILVAVIASIVVTGYGLAKKEAGGKIIKRLGGVMFWTLVVGFAFAGLVLSAPTFLLTLLIESLLAIVIQRYLKLPDWKLFKGVLIANVFTQPLLALSQMDPYLLGLNLPDISSMAMVVMLEGMVWLAEALIVYLVQGGELPFQKILLLTFILNAASFGIGLVLPI